MRPRLFVPQAKAIGDRVELPEDEAEHLLRVLRLGVGADADIIDGRGHLWRGEILHAGKRSAAVRLIESGTPARELGLQLSLVVSVLKGDKLDDVVRDAVMLGVTRIRPVISERSTLGLAQVERGTRVTRWRRIAVASAKQCGRAVVPAIDEAMLLASYFADRTPATRVMCVEPSAAAGEVHPVNAIAKSATIDVLIGPEGGWSAIEIAAAHDSGVILMSLGGRTLRADAVPIVALTALLATWGELR